MFKLIFLSQISNSSLDEFKLDNSSKKSYKLVLLILSTGFESTVHWTSQQIFIVVHRSSLHLK